ncbi:HAD family hydrolase [Sneathiella marina]|uniref:phosphoglycolate phosphatase n=1 Tax=Sneathiella marina TaxID=2950108 RepID=A0ABY4VYP2_9PROT|nr:HAD family hydrolase [Sneathiella marina]USG59714.1 HAD family hydrolase [Sneathiella marina]
MSGTKRNLAIFDIDGTIMHSAGHDVSLFREAHARHIPEDSMTAHWGNFSQMTDYAINNEFFDRVHGRAPTDEELNAIKSTFITLVKDAHTARPEIFSPVLGALHAIESLSGHTDWAVGFASGGWEISATYKLASMGIDADAYPTAFGDAHADRLTLVQSAIDAAKETHNRDGFDHVVSVGDGLWDIAAARDLNLPFIGISSWVSRDTLLEAGAHDVLDHFEDYAAFEQILLNSRVPD